jgi:2Fe-2S ferredoxin
MDKIKINIEDKNGILHEIEADISSKDSILKHIQNSNIDINGECGGIAECSSCHVYVSSNHQTPEMSMIEDMMLDEVESRQENSRLSCQLGLRDYMDGIKIKIPNN